MKRYKNKKINYVVLSSAIILFCVVFLSVGWSAFESTFNISNLLATIRIDRDIRVTGVSASSTSNSGSSNYEEYDVSGIYAAVYLPNSNSTVTYTVQVRNL